MNRFLTFLLLVISVVAASAANPTLENFDQTHFRTNNPPPGIIRTRLSSSNFDQSGDTWSITNVSGATGSSKWTNDVDDFMRVIPGNAINGIEITNVYIQKLLYNQGGNIWYGVLNSNLVAGLNELNPFNKNTLQLTGWSATPTDSYVTLSGGDGPGSLLIVENYSAGFGFCITNGTPQWDNPAQLIILPNGDWCPSAEGEQIWLRQNGHADWVEVLRVITSGPGFAIINPTDTYVPRRIDANTFGDSLLQYRDTNYMTLHGFGAGLFIGSHAEAWYGGGLTGEAIVAANIVADGDPDDAEMLITSVNGSNSAEFHVSGSSASMTTQLSVNGASPSQLSLTSKGIHQRLDSGDFHINFDPFGLIAATAPFYFNQDAVYDGTNVLAQIDYRTNTQFRVNIDSGYTGTGAKWLDDAGNYTVPGTSGITMNPTDGRVPYRFDATTLQDSPWFYHATNIMSFGSGTNQFLYQQDSDTFALGWEAAADRILGNNNVAIGMRSMMSADGQFQSVAVGNFTLQNHGGSDNTAIGHRALMAVNATAATAFGGNNTAIGFVAMDNITNGYNNTSIGSESLQDVGDGRENTGLGYHAGDLFSGVNSVFAGARAGNYSSQTTLTNVGAIGYNIQPTNNNDFLLGNSTNNVIIPGTLTVAGGITGGGANWTAEGTTNSTLAGIARANGGVFTNGITAGASTFTGEITSTLGTITADASALDATATWNAAGVTFTGLKLNITDTASAAASLFADFQIAGSTKLSIRKDGRIIGDGASPYLSLSQAGGTTLAYGANTLLLGASNITLGSGGLANANGFITANTAYLGWGSSSLSSPDTKLFRDGAANTMQGGEDSATAAAFTFKGPDGSGTDKVGGALQLGGGKSTGTAAGGALILHTANSAGASASSLNTITERFHAPAKWVTLTSATATTIFTIPVPATNYVGLTATVTVYATDGTDHQSKTSVITCDAINKAGTITETLTQVDNTTAASSGTLTATYDSVDAGSNVVGIRVAADSSLTETVLRAKIVVTAINSNGSAALVEQ